MWSEGCVCLKKKKMQQAFKDNTINIQKFPLEQLQRTT